MPERSWTRLRLLLPAIAASLCGSPPAGAQALSAATPGPLTGAAVRPAPGLEIHYELLSPSDASAGPGRLEGIMSGARGELRTSVLLNPAAEGGQRVARLDTAWQTQAPGPLRTLVVGDTFGSGGDWGNPVRVGGVRIGRSLTLRPSAVPAPQAAVQGLPGLMPSLPGPLVAAATAGSGSAMSAPAPWAAMRQPIASPAALDAGASDYEVEAGRLRSGWGTVDDRYGEGYAGAAYRAGLGAELTAEARAEWTPSRTAAGLEMSRAFGPAGAVHAVLAQSGTAQQTGLRWGMGMVRNIEGGSWTLSWDGFERGFTPLGALSGEADPRGRLQADATVSLGGRASAGLTYTRQSTWESPAAGVLEVSARLPLLERSSLSLNYSQRAGTQPGWRAGLTLAVPMGGDRL